MAADDIAATIREIQERVRARYPNGATPFGSVPLADLMPLVHARDAAEGKVAAIGTVNPRRPGLVNRVIQIVKRTVSRSLRWHVREQVEFNRGVMACFEATLAALNQNNQALTTLAARTQEALDKARGEVRDAFRDSDATVSGISEVLTGLKESVGDLSGETALLKHEAAELKDIRTYWSQWRQEWEHKLSVNEIRFLRGIADLQAGFTHRSTQMESNFREIANSQLERASVEIQKRLWEDLARIREDYERLIHNELRVIRQRASTLAPAQPVAEAAPAVAQPVELQYDSLRFADRFRGTEEYVRENQKFYLPYFKKCRNVLDIGCGRGEFLSVAKEAGIPARGIDLSEESVALCRNKGLNAEVADLFPYLAGLCEGELDGIFCGQVIEHLPPERLPEFIRLASEKLAHGGVIALETPNPECLAIFATHFYLDPTHIRPVPPPLLVFFLEEAGFGSIEVARRFPAEESMSAIRGLPREFLDGFFGGLDYAAIARRL